MIWWYQPLLMAAKLFKVASHHNLGHSNGCNRTQTLGCYRIKGFSNDTLWQRFTIALEENSGRRLRRGYLMPTNVTGTPQIKLGVHVIAMITTSNSSYKATIWLVLCPWKYCSSRTTSVSLTIRAPGHDARVRFSKLINWCLNSSPNSFPQLCAELAGWHNSSSIVGTLGAR